MAETGFDAGPKKLASSVGEFVGANEAYYAREFDKIQSATKFPWSWNTMAALVGPLWGPARGLWGFFWTFIVLELLALVQIGRGLWGDLGADKMARAEKLLDRSNALFEKGKVALQNGESDAQGLITTAGNLKRAAARLVEQAGLAAAESTTLLVIGLVVLVVVRVVEGYYANLAYEKRYLEWRGNPLVASGLNWQIAAFGGLLWLGIVPLTLYRFTVSKPWELITRFPMEKQIFTPVANEMEGWFDWLATHGAGVFDGITQSIRAVLDGLEVVLVQTPWPVVMLVIVVTAWRLAGPRIAIFTAASLAYLAFLGLWEVSMATVALLGAAAFLCLIFGIPLGIWFGKSERAHSIALPVLDFMQTMPAFVYLIPIIAFFGTGKPPGVLATVVFGMPPGHPAHGAWHATGSRGYQGSRGGLRLYQRHAAARCGNSACDAVNHGRSQPDDSDVPVHGRDRIADRGRRARQERAGGAPVRGEGAGHAGGARDSVLRHGDRPSDPGSLQAHGRQRLGLTRRSHPTTPRPAPEKIGVEDR